MVDVTEVHSDDDNVDCVDKPISKDPIELHNELLLQYKVLHQKYRDLKKLYHISQTETSLLRDRLTIIKEAVKMPTKSVWLEYDSSSEE